MLSGSGMILKFLKVKYWNLSFPDPIYQSRLLFKTANYTESLIVLDFKITNLICSKCTNSYPRFRKK